ncbi:glycosyltransferase family 2 protein [Heliorestis acidaminivorans]|uniref:Glucosyl-3-phosphoglycerate synthase n=1 Tax=Heliorestis acidaminivorans TaxID=553427 RepID=A0A6I0F3N0_9FIRM|nr:glycosyltransferase family 2 protein [Heliorestis acidaminivorans]KAB2954360.1 glycosyltransferase family 2 protein [Heliorestis acidaminivorans]
MSVSVIIPAYNEERTITEVVQVVNTSPYNQDIIVVSDGSMDNTTTVAHQAGAKVLELPENIGKGGAMKAGVQEAKYEILLFLDADLIGLRKEHIQSLVEPILDGNAEMTVGVFEKGRLATDFAQLITPYLSGQRAVLKSIFLNVSELEASRYGVEAALTQHFRNSTSLRIIEVLLPDLTHLMKEEKLGLVKGFKERMKMYWEIAKWVK